MNSKVVVLNSDFAYHSTVSWKHAIKMLHRKVAEVVKNSGKVLVSPENRWKQVIPRVLKLVKFVDYMYKKRVPCKKSTLLIRDNRKCQYCGSSRELTIDHVVPASRGGKTEFENCVMACQTCNNKKDNRTPREANMRLLRSPLNFTLREYLLFKMKSLGVDGVLRELGAIS